MLIYAETIFGSLETGSSDYHWEGNEDPEGGGLLLLISFSLFHRFTSYMHSKSSTSLMGSVILSEMTYKETNFIIG